MEKDTEITVAMSHYEDVANLIAKMLPCPCIVRYVDLNNTLCQTGKCFFKEVNNKNIA
jgi:hypothetical protein